MAARLGPDRAPPRKLTEVLKQHAGGSGIAYLWEQQLLNTPVPEHRGLTRVSG